MRLPIAIGSRRFKRWHILGGALLLLVVWTVYLILFQLADALITSFRKYIHIGKNCLTSLLRTIIVVLKISYLYRNGAETGELDQPQRRRMETSVVVAHYIGAGHLFGNLTDGMSAQRPCG